MDSINLRFIRNILEIDWKCLSHDDEDDCNDCDDDDDDDDCNDCGNDDDDDCNGCDDDGDDVDDDDCCIIQMMLMPIRVELYPI